MPELVLFGAGSIGRSFIGQLFGCGGYEVVFVDIDDRIVDVLNQRGSYRVEIADDPPGEIVVPNVRAVNGKSTDAVVEELAAASLAATAVGAGALRHLYPVIAAGLLERQRRGAGPLDIVLAENLHGAAAIVRDGLRVALPPGFPLEDAVGLVETSIGKMVPLMPPAAREQDPLLIRAERFNTLIVDAAAFKNPVPAIPGLDARSNMAAYVDRKLYIHNLGHAAVAYLSALWRPDFRTIADAVQDPRIREVAAAAMQESATALARAYPGEFTPETLAAHVDDLLRRFANPHLGDTVFRVGRDVRRKLGRHDRIIGAMLMDLEHGVEPHATALVAAAAVRFRVADDQGQLDPGDARFAVLAEQGFDGVLSTVSALDEARTLDVRARQLILGADRDLAAGN